MQSLAPHREALSLTTVITEINGHLDEHNVPYFQNIRVVQVDKVGCVAAAYSVIVDLAAGPARPLVSHLPEVVCAPKGQYPGRW